MTSSVATSRSSASSSTGWSAGSDEPGPRVSICDKGDRSAAGAHADRLVALEVLALRLQRGGDHQLGPVELRDVLVAAGRHRRAQTAHEVERAVVLPRRAAHDLLQRAV